VARVRASLISNHPVGTLGEHVYQLPLPLVSPLRADDDDDTRFRTEHDTPERWFPAVDTQNAPRGAGRCSNLGWEGGESIARRANARRGRSPPLVPQGFLDFGSFARPPPLAFHSLIMSNCRRCAFCAAARSPEPAARESFCTSV